MEIKVRNDIPVPEESRRRVLPPPQKAKWVFQVLKTYQDSMFVEDTTERKAKSRFAQWRVHHPEYNLMQIVVRAEKQPGENGKQVPGVRIWRDKDRTEEEALAARSARRQPGKKNKRKKPMTASNKISTNQVRSQLKSHRK